jgi:hypothetical protein
MGQTQKIDGSMAFTSRLLDENIDRRTTQSKENEPQKPFVVTFNTPRNLLQKAFTTQSHIGWDNFLKGRISRDWLTCVRHNEENSNGQRKSQDWSAKFIVGLWEHLKRLCQFRNDIYHQETERTIVRKVMHRHACAYGRA